MVKQIRTLSERSLEDVKRIINDSKGPSKPNKNWVGEDQPYLPPEFYVAYTPVGGIPALTETTAAFPGVAECEVYRVINQETTPELEQVEGLTRDVHNLSVNSISGEEWIEIARDKFGSWLAITSGTTVTKLVQLTAKCYYDGSDTRDVFECPTGVGLNCEPEPDCVKRFIAYSWVKVIDTNDPYPLIYTDGNEAGSPSCWPVYHIQNIDLPVFPGPSPQASYPRLVENVSGAGSVDWTTPSSADTTNDIWASCLLTAGQETRYLKATEFCFGIGSGVDAEVTGIAVLVEAHASDGTVVDVEVKLVIGGSIVGTSKHTGAALSTSDTIRTYSGTLASWGVTAIPKDINSQNFGVALRYKNNSGSDRTVYVDSITIEVSFTPAGGIGVHHSIVRVFKGAGDYWLMDNMPWTDLFERTNETDAYGYIGYLHYWDPNAEEFRRGEEVRIIIA